MASHCDVSLCYRKSSNRHCFDDHEANNAKLLGFLYRVCAMSANSKDTVTSNSSLGSCVVCLGALHMHKNYVLSLPKYCQCKRSITLPASLL